MGTNRPLGPDACVAFETQGRRVQSPSRPPGTSWNPAPSCKIGHVTPDPPDPDLRALLERLQSTVEELETVNEEIQSSNEELETMNEELQASYSEIETTSGELHH